MVQKIVRLNFEIHSSTVNLPLQCKKADYFCNCCSLFHFPATVSRSMDMDWLVPKDLQCLPHPFLFLAACEPLLQFSLRISYQPFKYQTKSNINLKYLKSKRIKRQTKPTCFLYSGVIRSVAYLYAACRNPALWHSITVDVKMGTMSKSYIYN